MRWLHISDIHFGYDSAAVETMRKKTLELAENIEKVDCLFVTGDLRYGKKETKSYPPETLTFIQDLQKALGVGPEDTFVVAGNHDVNRDEMLEAGIEKAAEGYITSSGNIPDATLNYIRGQRAPFLALYRQVCGCDEPGWHYCRQKGGFNIICLNTALFCCRDGEDGSLIVGSKLLNELAKTVDSRLPGIVLAHHDFDSLRQEERQELEIALKDMGAVVYLCGHQHVALSRRQNTYRANQDLHVFLCGTSVDKDPNLEQVDMDVFVGEIEKTGRSGCVQAFKWNRRFHDWVPDVDFSYPENKAVDGRRYFPPGARPQPPKPLNKNVLEKYNEYIRSQCSEVELNGLPTNLEDVERKYALERIFVPLTFKRFEGRKEDAEELLEVYREAEISVGDSLAFREKMKPVTLDKVVPPDGNFCCFVLSDPGGGKTTLLKWIASVYSFPEDYRDKETNLPWRELFPVWIRCRDIPVGTRPSLWNTIENITRLGEWMPGDSGAEDFIRLVSHHIENGTALLLVDGLDEIGSDADRQHFVNQLRIFTERHPMANMVVTSRITGFPAMTNKTFKGFDSYEIAPLGRGSVKDLCVKWFGIVDGESEASREKGKALAGRITEDMRIFRLARNPLLLTTLLLVERRVGRLPTKRTALYDEAIQVLLETWNRAGHGHERVDPDEARYQLAYVAFYMTVNHIKRITKDTLTDLLRAVRRDFSDLVSNGEPVSVFVDNIEKRSALLIQKGFDKSEDGRMAAVYEFQHLTFQEYLAAFAVAKRCYPGLEDEDSPGAVLKPHLLDTTLKETISLAAIMDRFCAREIVEELLTKTAAEAEVWDAYVHLHILLLQFIADEVQLKADTVDRILDYCFKDDRVWYMDRKLLPQILEGRYKEKLIALFSAMDQKLHNGFPRYGLLLQVLSGQIADPYQYYLDNRTSDSVQRQAEALSVLADGVWTDTDDTLRKVGEKQMPKLRAEILDFLLSEDENVLNEAFDVVYDGLFISDGKEAVKYLEACVGYINRFRRRPTIYDGFLRASILEDFQVRKEIRIEREAFQQIYAEARGKRLFEFDLYRDMLAFGMIAAVTRLEAECMEAWFALTRERYGEMLVWAPSTFTYLLEVNYNFSELMEQAVLRDPSYNAAQKAAVQRHILETDLSSAWYMKTLEDEEFTYSDHSLTDGSAFRLSYPDDSVDDVIDYINCRLESIRNPSEQECAAISHVDAGGSEG